MRAAVFQCEGGGLGPEQRLQQLENALSGQGLDLVVCAELFMSGYFDEDENRVEPASNPFTPKVLPMSSV